MAMLGNNVGYVTKSERDVNIVLLEGLAERFQAFQEKPFTFTYYTVNAYFLAS